MSTEKLFRNIYLYIVSEKAFSVDVKKRRMGSSLPLNRDVWGFP
jgi:hypothetical protein